MIKKIFLTLLLGAAAYTPVVNASENDLLARINWNININAGYCPYYYNPYCYPYPPPCAYPYPPGLYYWGWY